MSSIESQADKIACKNAGFVGLTYTFSLPFGNSLYLGGFHPNTLISSVSGVGNVYKNLNANGVVEFEKCLFFNTKVACNKQVASFDGVFGAGLARRKLLVRQVS